MRKFEGGRRGCLTWLGALAAATTAGTPRAQVNVGRTAMPLRLTLKELASASRIKLPSPAPVRIGPERLQHFAALAAAGTATATDPIREIDPLVALALLPSLLAELLVVTDASANHIAVLQNCVFVQTIPADAAINIEAELMQGQVNADGHVAYRIGFAWRINNGSPPAIVGELLGMAGNATPARR